ncbi:hypothetical protein M885DRAFT_539591 [Pelagophyceae sp. CCMP2097]|nr:hypothetical protein M885DRAFT_539591 [Pelagophyceae sp. CCMP2097]|mmetsp:Transcript_3629/g.13276  ORF Transcript_3629/g.13276 Transcript_3629/m.13276 type:complete len:219 (-) Transcript_3629:36-692(-)
MSFLTTLPENPPELDAIARLRAAVQRAEAAESALDLAHENYTDVIAEQAQSAANECGAPPDADEEFEAPPDEPAPLILAPHPKTYRPNTGGLLTDVSYDAPSPVDARPLPSVDTRPAPSDDARPAPASRRAPVSPAAAYKEKAAPPPSPAQEAAQEAGRRQTHADKMRSTVSAVTANAPPAPAPASAHDEPASEPGNYPGTDIRRKGGKPPAMSSLDD